MLIREWIRYRDQAVPEARAEVEHDDRWGCQLWRDPSDADGGVSQFSGVPLNDAPAHLRECLSWYFAQRGFGHTPLCLASRLKERGWPPSLVNDLWVHATRVEARAQKAVVEALPLPEVLYPTQADDHAGVWTWGGTGTFLAQRQDENASIAVCCCTTKAIENYLRMQEGQLSGTWPDAVVARQLAMEFPPALIAGIVKDQLSSCSDIMTGLQFEPGLCHRCNATTPAVPLGTATRDNPHYTVEYGWQYGWYLRLQYYEWGLPHRR